MTNGDNRMFEMGSYDGHSFFSRKDSLANGTRKHSLVLFLISLGRFSRALTDPL